jgi:hypothetical protein
MLIFLLSLAGLYLVSIAIFVIAIRKAPYASEDEKGFQIVAPAPPRSEPPPIASMSGFDSASPAASSKIIEAHPELNVQHV